MTTKTVDDHGRLVLGPEFAGQVVNIDDSNPERIVITRASAAPPMTNDALGQLAARHHPPAKWLEGEEEELF
jgi:hypothetical protein